MNVISILFATVTVVSPVRESTVDVLRPLHREVVSMDAETRHERLSDKDFRARMKKVGTTPAELTVEWTYAPTEKGARPIDKTRFRVILTPASEPTAAEWYFADATNRLVVRNLRVAERYELEVAALGAKSRVMEAAKSAFRTEEAAPRWINMEGVGNVRDLGGWKTVDGRRVRQGLVYRSQGLNDNADWFTRDPQTHKKVAKPKDQWKVAKERGTALSRKRVLAQLGIKTDLDLRRAENECWGMTGSPLGPSVRWLNVTGTYYEAMDNPASYENFKRQFRVFLDPANYPIDFHCIGGADRTGTLAYLLGGLLGVAERDLDLDYELTCFASDASWPDGGKDPGCRSALTRMKAAYANYPGRTINERIESFVRARGFTDGEIARFRAIMFGELPVFRPTADTVYAAFREGSSMQRRQVMQDPGWRKFANDAGVPPKGADAFDVPQWRKAAGVENLRDLGGWRGLDGRRVRRGRIFRSAYLDRVKDPEAVFAALGAKPATDLDLRTSEHIEKIGGKSPLGIRLVNRSAPSYEGFFGQNGRAYFRKVFRLFLDESNYPILFHCAKGADRTGSLAFLLNGLLGVDEDDLELDWQATAFFNPNPAFQSERYDRLLEALARQNGRTWFEKLVDYAHSCGLSDDELARFRELMLEPAPAAPRLTFGVLSDVHLGLFDDPAYLLRAFEAFRRRMAEAIVICGDVVSDGRIAEYERFAEIWRTAFGAMPGKAGAPELVVAWGNHDYLEASKFRGKAIPPEELRTFMARGDGRERVWKMLFDEPYPGEIFLKRMKGVPFVCAHWKSENALGPWLKEHVDEIGVSNLFFVVQHPHPSETVFGAETSAKENARDLSAYSQAFVLSGHSHMGFADDAALWQGAFTSMACGTPLGSAVRHGVGTGAYANAVFKRKSARRPYPHMRSCRSGKTSSGLLVTVGQEQVTVERMDFLSGQKLGEDWELPLPLQTHPEAPFVFAAAARAPEFPPEAKVTVRFADGQNAADEPERQLLVEVAQARPVGPYSRAIFNTFEVVEEGSDKVLLKADALQDGQGLPVEAGLRYPAACAFGAADLPAARSLYVRVTPRNAAGTAGKPIVSAVFKSSSSCPKADRQ